MRSWKLVLAKFAGRCELWHCVTYARLKMSAGPGGNPEENSQVVEVSDRIIM